MYGKATQAVMFAAGGIGSPHLLAVIARFLGTGAPATIPYVIAALIGFVLLFVEPLQVGAVGFIFGIVIFLLLMNSDPTGGDIPRLFGRFIWPPDVRPAF